MHVENENTGEPIGRIRVAYGSPASFAIAAHEVPAVIDEIPGLAALGALLPEGAEMRVEGAAELRVKESDRISCLATGLRALGASVEDSRRIPHRVPTALRWMADAADDHRLAMAFAIAGTGATGPTTDPRCFLGQRFVPGFFRRARAADAVTADKIYLVGFMAAGKTTVARALAARLGWRAEDVDELIEARERRPVADIFARAWRAVLPGASSGRSSRSCCPSVTSSWPPAAGPSSSRRIVRAINLDGLSVWLDVPHRSRRSPGCPADGRRPLAADRGQMERLFAARRAAYAQAHLRVEVGLAPADEIAEQIAAIESR